MNEQQVISTLQRMVMVRFSNHEEIPSRKEVIEILSMLADHLGYTGPLEQICDIALTQLQTRMGLGVSLINTRAEHDAEWVSKRRDITWYYLDTYGEYLGEQGWPKTVVEGMRQVSQRILGHLQDPTSEGATWDRRGLVIGHVQSGKTANYIALTAGAADAGYKLIIIIAGIHNNLRRQTQERVDEGFVGRSSDPRDQYKKIGVGKYDPEFPHPATLTNVVSDFNKAFAEKSGWKFDDFSKPIILVIKKNVKTLDRLYEWMESLNARGGRISNVPMLMIDDEADNASINTSKSDVNPTRTNACIRKILKLFDKSCYVGYTATPFANIFINPEAYDNDVREELFPRDFIYSLDAPNTYFGPDKVFIEDMSPPFTVPIWGEDADVVLPMTHKRNHQPGYLPASLVEALDLFIVAKAIRIARGQGHEHCSMMVNVSRFIDVQKEVRTLVDAHLRETADSIRAHYRLPAKSQERSPVLKRIRQAFKLRYSDCELGWTEILPYLADSADSVKVLVINSKSDESLDYRSYGRNGESLTAVAIGGLTLSRGLTIEGLCISYMYRNTRMYDTLMQMGRWFGYRPGYEDLCRVYLSPDSIRWYSHIAEASEELREQIRIMRRNGLTPQDFGLYVKAHPDRLLITAPNKMQSAESVTMQYSFAGKLRETHILKNDEEAAAANYDLVRKYWKDGFGRQEVEQVWARRQDGSRGVSRGWIIRDVDTELVAEFLDRFRVHPFLMDLCGPVQEFLRKCQDQLPKSDVLLVSIAANDEDATTFTLGYQERGNQKRKVAPGVWRLTKDRVAGRGDESLGLTDKQIKEAEDLARHDEVGNRGKSRSGPSDIHFRSVRGRPLLMIHSLKVVPENEPAFMTPAIGVSFPDVGPRTVVEVKANRVWMERMYGSFVDSPEDDDDDGE